MENGRENFRVYEDLFINNFDELCAYAFTYVSDIDVSKDIVQDVFMALWVKREEYIPSKALLYKGVKNKSIDYLKSSYIKNKHTETALDNYIQSLIIEQDSNLYLNDLYKEIQYSITILPDQCRKVFLLSRESDMKNAEVAESLGITVKAVEKQITKAISQIRKHLYNKGLLPLLIYFFLFFS